MVPYITDHFSKYPASIGIEPQKHRNIEKTGPKKNKVVQIRAGQSNNSITHNGTIQQNNINNNNKK